MASRIDFAVAHVIGIAAILLYAIQTLLKIQLANKVREAGSLSFLAGAMLAVFLFSLHELQLIERIKENRASPWSVVGLFGSLVATLASIYYKVGWSPSIFTISVAGFITTYGFLSAIVWFAARASRRSRT